jgi:non-heme chloroperoxidase
VHASLSQSRGRFAITPFLRPIFRREVAAITLPTMIVQGDKDTAAPIDFTGRRTAHLIKGSLFKVYSGAPHGLIVTHAEQFNHDLAQFAAT